MSRNFNGSSDYLEYSGAVRTALPVTMACWNYTAVTTVPQVCISLSTAAGTNSLTLRLINGALVRARSANTSGAAANADTTATYSTNTWFHAAAVFTSNTSRTVYLNGGNAVNNATSNDPSASTFNTTSIGNTLVSSTRSNIYSGRLAEAGIWSVALTADEISSLSKGVSPTLIRPGNLIAYWPLVGEFSPEIDTHGKFDMTVSGATKDEHPRIYMPNTTYYPYSVPVANYFKPPSGLALLGVGT